MSPRRPPPLPLLFPSFIPFWRIFLLPTSANKCQCRVNLMIESQNLFLVCKVCVANLLRLAINFFVLPFWLHSTARWLLIYSLLYLIDYDWLWLVMISYYWLLFLFLSYSLSTSHTFSNSSNLSHSLINLLNCTESLRSPTYIHTFAYIHIDTHIKTNIIHTHTHAT